MNIQKKKKTRKTHEPQTNDKCKIRQAEIKQRNIHRHTRTQTKQKPKQS